MITAIIRKLTPTIVTIYADNKKRHVEATIQWFTTLDGIFIRKRTRVRFHAVNALKEKSRKLKQLFSDDYRDNQKTHADNKNYSRR
jgi:hypothetical protein